jgi:hypothetical protein
MAAGGLVRSVWTTNFDGLVARAAAAYQSDDFCITPVEIGLDSPNRVIRTPTRGELLCVALHGDYRYDRLKNTQAELGAGEGQLHAALVTELRQVACIVVGYSGRDRSVMASLTTANSVKSAGRLFWCGVGEDGPPDHVARLLQSCKASGNEAFFVRTEGFDDLMARIELHLYGESDDVRQTQEVDFEASNHLTELALVRGQRSEVLGKLITRLAGAEGPPPSERHWIYVTFGRIGGSVARGELSRGQNDPDEFARMGAVKGLELLLQPRGNSL